MLEPLFWLLVGHAVGDFGLQSDWMARYKNRHMQGQSVFSAKPELIWLEVLSAHCLIHAGAVALATGSVLLGLLEFVAHWLIDFCKCEDYFGFHTDQCLHIACKILWFVMLTQGWLV